MDTKYLSLLILLLVLSATGVTASAGIHRWVDENGQVQFGDRPPANMNNSEEVVIRKQVPTSEPAKVDRKKSRERLLEQYQRERDEKKQKAAKKQKEKKERKARCNYAKTRLTEYREHGSLYERLPNQQRRYLTDQERDAQIAKARAEVKKWCK